MSVIRNSKFETRNSLADLETAIERDMAAADNEFVALERTLQRLRGRIDNMRAEVARLQADLDATEYIPEARVMEMFGYQGTHKSFVDWRTKQQWPYLRIGGTVVYTRAHLAAIAEICEVKAGVKFKKAA